MKGCTCEHVVSEDAAERAAARYAIHTRPLSHAHAFYGAGLPTHIRDSVDNRTLGYPIIEIYPSPGECYRIYICGNLYLGLLYNGQWELECKTCPIGYPMFVSKYRMYPLAATRVYDDLDGVIKMLAAPSVVSRHAVHHCTVFDKCKQHIRKRTGAWMRRRNESGDIFVSLCGVVPPIRREFGEYQRVLMSRGAVVYATRQRKRGRTRTCTRVILWDIPKRFVHVMRLPRGFTVNSEGHLVIGNRMPYRWPLI